MPSRTKRRTYRKKSGVFATPIGWTPPGGGSTRESVLAAAEIFAVAARANASKFSTRIPAATGVIPLDEQRALVKTDGVEAPNAAPFEFGERHPLFGNRGHWYKQPTRAYMSNAARNPGNIEYAADVYEFLEAALLANEYGYTE